MQGVKFDLAMVIQMRKCTCLGLPSNLKQPGTNHTLSCPCAPKCSGCGQLLIVCACGNCHGT